jgi:hypothetical protein
MTAAQFDIKAKYGMRRIKALEKMQGKHFVKVGVLRGTGSHPKSDGVSIALIAWWNEFGTKRIPSRPFLRTTLREHNYYKQEVFEAFKASLADARKGGPDRQESRLKLIGILAVSDIQKKITDGPWKPNTESTIERKSVQASYSDLDVFFSDRRSGKEDGDLSGTGIKNKPLIDTGTLRASIKSAVVKE